jgi:uncharacterized protein (TIGR03435 family)
MLKQYRPLLCPVLALSLAGISPQIYSQSVARPAFEVASVKPNSSGRRGYALPPPKGGRFTATNVSLKALVLYAYHLQDGQVIGSNGWINSAPYDVEAKAEGSPVEARVRLMAQVLLEERFKLKMHREERQLSIYTLRLAKKGLQMQRSTVDCSSVGPTVPCGGFQLFQRRQLTGRNVPMDELVDVLSTLTGRMVADKTGLAGNYDIKLEWNPDQNLAFGAEAGVPTSDNAPQAALFTALEEQLGLRLQSEKASVPVFVIDSAEKPAEN